MDSKGFSIIEVLVAIFVLIIAALAVSALAVLATRNSFEAERQTVALGLVNGYVENIRSLPYSEVGYVDAHTLLEPDGVLLREEVVTRNRQEYIVYVSVDLIDSPENGTLPAGELSEINADLKRVTISAEWEAIGGRTREVSVTTDVEQARALTDCRPGETGACPGGLVCSVHGLCPPFPKEPYCPPGALFCP